ncbi:hypothetical protein PGTUg99_005496 [Puccinia graminis f. sp. tritici]|uniref:Wax synthase domain-containing protein n=1 Tax=Puccinia graminis f. sp. tritici TaxID=56615 RepID=A0A5B0NB44_PUCGR|nr:hypothetical protein PGTUg99_005496 [Puccinia graminis f. sp. tritici]
MHFFEYLTHPKLLGHAGLMIPLTIQAALLHPYYQQNVTSSVVRRSLIPIAVIMAFVTAPMRKWLPLEDSMMVNFCFVSLVTFHATCLAFEYGLHEGPVLGPKCELEEAELSGEENETSISPEDSIKSQSIGTTEARKRTNNHASTDGETKSTTMTGDSSESNVKNSPTKKKEQLVKPSTGELVRFVLWLLFSPRGLECQWAPHPSIVTFRKPISTSTFILRETLGRVFVLHAYGTMCWALATCAFHHPQGFYGIIKDVTGLSESSVIKFFAGYGTSFCIGACMWTGLEIAAAGMNLFEFLLYSIGRRFLPVSWAPEKPFNPRRYPPLFSKPWESKSMSEFWGRGWHALFRRDLTFCGALPAFKLAAMLGFGKQVQKLSGLMGAMFLSGLMHEYAIASISWEKTGPQIIFFFMECAIVMAVENLIEKHTKIRFKGIWGTIWTFGFLMYFGKPGLDLW